MDQTKQAIGTVALTIGVLQLQKYWSSIDKLKFIIKHNFDGPPLLGTNKI